MDYIIETPRLIIKPVSAFNVSMILDFYIKNREYFEPFEQDRLEGFYTLNFQQKVALYERQEFSAKKTLRFYFYLKEAKDQILGTVSFSNVTLGGLSQAVIGYKIDHDHIQQGYTKEALQALLTHVKHMYHLHRIEAYIHPHNEASIKTALSVGFEEEGIAREYVLKNGIYQDMCRYVYLAR